MTSPLLPTSLDVLYGDSVTDPSVALHQQHHDRVHGIANSVQTALAGAAGLSPVASNAITGTGTANYGTDALRSWIMKHTLLVDTPVIALEFANWYPTGAGADTDGPAAMTLRVGVEWGASITGTDVRPVKWPGGADTVTIPAGGQARSELVYVDGKAGDTFYTRVTCTMASGTTYVYNNTADINAGYAFSPVQDNSRSGTNYAGGSNQSVAPIRILGRPATAKRSVALVGDSIMQGANATQPFIGGFEQALVTQRVPFVKIPRGGETAGSFALLATSHRRLALVSGCTDAIVEYGTNDLGGNSAATVEAGLVAIWFRLARMGQRVQQSTITPRTTSTDSWATTTNQTPVTGFAAGGNREQLNTWIRAGAPISSTTFAPVAVGTSGALVAGQAGHPLVGFIEVADAVESARNSGVWKAGYTSDGIHPSQNAHDAIAAVIPTFA